MNEIILADFYKEEYADTLEKVSKFIKKDSFSFLFMTDMHIDWADEHDVIIRQCNAMVKLCRQADIDCIVLGGDIIHGIRTKERSLELFGEYVEVLKKAGVPVIAVHGNHDDNAYYNTGVPEELKGKYSTDYVPADRVITGEDWSRYIVEPLCADAITRDSKNPNSNYFYADFEDKKVRIIALDVYDYPFEVKESGHARYVAENWAKMSDRQMKWFAEEALDTQKNGWYYIVTGHPTLTDTKVHQTFKNSNVVCDILASFNKKQVYKNVEYGIAVDYSANGAKAPVYVFGHTHADYYDHDVKTGMLFIGTANAKTTTYNFGEVVYEYMAVPAREKGTVTEAAFDCYIYDTDGGFKRIRFGAGEDQFF